MDGFEVNVQKVYDMDPNRIESITILKDAAATAMYGSRAANGVVVITTVAPKPGEVTVTYSLTGGVTFPDLSDYNLANAEEKLEIERLAGLYDPEEGATSISKQDAYWRRYKNIAEGADTDWISKPLRNAVTHKHSLYIEGGNSDLRYALDASFNGDNGVMKKSYRNRTGVGLQDISITITRHGNLFRHHAQIISYQIYNRSVFRRFFRIVHQLIVCRRKRSIYSAFHRIRIDFPPFYPHKNFRRKYHKSIFQP